MSSLKSDLKNPQLERIARAYDIDAKDPFFATMEAIDVLMLDRESKADPTKVYTDEHIRVLGKEFETMRCALEGHLARQERMNENILKKYKSIHMFVFRSKVFLLLLGVSMGFFIGLGSPSVLPFFKSPVALPSGVKLRSHDEKNSHVLEVYGMRVLRSEALEDKVLIEYEAK